MIPSSGKSKHEIDLVIVLQDTFSQTDSHLCATETEEEEEEEKEV